MITVSEKILAISGGIGGAKLVLGLSRCLGKSQLTVVANTGDDFEHLGLHVSPDIDTLLYTLADINNIELGWGRRDESWNFAEACQQLQMETWFRLGDRDLATHIYRSMRLKDGASLSQVIGELCQRFNLQTTILPMSDQAVRTMVETASGTMAFQEYFVKNQCKPVLSKIYFKGIENAEPATALLNLLDHPELKAIIICPSNPFLSVQPVLSLPGLKEKIISSKKPVIVVSPVVNGQSLKGPTAKIMKELNLGCDVKTIAELYRDIASAIVIDKQDENDADDIRAMGLAVHSSNIVMRDLQDKIDLAAELLEYSRNF